MRRVSPAPQHCDSCNTPYPSVPVWGWEVRQRVDGETYSRHPNVSHYRLCPECAGRKTAHSRVQLSYDRRALTRSQGCPLAYAMPKAEVLTARRDGHLLRRSRRQSGLIIRIRQVRLLSPLPSAGQVVDLAAPPRSPDLVGRLFFASLEPSAPTAGSQSAASAPRVAARGTNAVPGRQGAPRVPFWGVA